VALGYANVAVYPGGKQDWSGAGFPVERITRQDGGLAVPAAVFLRLLHALFE